MQKFVFPGKTWEGKVPTDYQTNKTTGLRKDMTMKPVGVVKHNLRTGIGGAVLPPLITWKAGKYLTELSKEGQDTFGKYVNDWEEFDAFVVTGEFTPGNYLARIYVLPKDISTSHEPDHPADWPEKLRKGNAVTSYNQEASGVSWKTASEKNWSVGGGYSGYSGYSYSTPKPSGVSGIKSTEAKLPFGVRIRCGGCGHWFKMDDLSSHAEYCCPGINGEDSDWAFQCECCNTLDQVQTVKPGFPRPKKEEPKQDEPASK